MRLLKIVLSLLIAAAALIAGLVGAAIMAMIGVGIVFVSWLIGRRATRLNGPRRDPSRVSRARDADAIDVSAIEIPADPTSR